MISDASPLIFFGKLHRLDILCKAYPHLLISTDVYQEVVVEGGKKDAPDALLVGEYIAAGKIIIRPLGKFFSQEMAHLLSLYQALDRGEASTLALALQEKNKEVLIDEQVARKVARLIGLQPYGSLRVLLQAYERKQIRREEVISLFRQLLAAGLYVSGDVVEGFYEMLERMERK